MKYFARLCAVIVCLEHLLYLCLYDARVQLTDQIWHNFVAQKSQEMARRIYKPLGEVGDVTVAPAIL